MIVCAHLLHALPAVLQRFQRRILRDDRGAKHGVLVHLHHGIDQRRRSAGVANAPARHGKRLGKAMEKNRALLHARQAGNAGVGAIESELGVNLVGQNQQVFLPAELSDLDQLLPAAGATGGIAGEIQHQHLRAGLPSGAERFRRERKVVLGKRRHRNRSAMGQRDAGMVAHVARLVVHHLVAGVDESAAGQVEGFAHTYRDDDLILRPVARAEMLLDVFRDLLTKLQLTEIRGVRCPAAIHRLDRVVPDVLGRHEVRLSYPQGNDPSLLLHLGDQVEEIANATLRQSRNVAGHPGLRVAGHDGIAWNATGCGKQASDEGRTGFIGKTRLAEEEAGNPPKSSPRSPAKLA